jgi:hypothetical protein
MKVIVNPSAFREFVRSASRPGKARYHDIYGHGYRFSIRLFSF